MSISSMSELAATRNLRAPTRADVGSAAHNTEAGVQPAGLTDLLAKTLPVGLITGYTAFIAVVAELTAPTRLEPMPDQLLWLRWSGFALLVLAASTLTYQSYRNKVGTGQRFPLLEVSAVSVAAGSWGLAIPSSPLLTSIADQRTAVGALALIAFVGVVVNTMLANQMRSADHHGAAPVLSPG